MSEISVLTILKTHLIIKISKRQAVDGKPETYGGVYEDWLCARLETGATRGTSDRCVERSRMREMVYGQDDRIESGAQGAGRGASLCKARGHVRRLETGSGRALFDPSDRAAQGSPGAWY